MKKILGCLLILLCISKSYAAHIIGGDVVYKCLRQDTTRKTTTFEISFTMYRDSRGNGANFDSPAEFGVFRTTGGGYFFDKSITSNPTGIEAVTYSNPCIIVPPNIGVEKANYTFNVEIPWSNATYMIVYQRCCRNGTISNILRPGSTGAAFYVEISPEATRSCNNSPNFKNFPPIVICNGEPLKFDHSARDAEGDQLVYEFCNPLTAGGTDGENGGDPRSCTGVRPNPLNCTPPFAEVSFLVPNYTAAAPMAGNPTVSIDPASGLITGVPNINGQFVVGVCVKEYRNGRLLGTTRRDFQFNVTQCQIAVDARINFEKSKVLGGYIETHQVGNTFNFKSCGSNTIPFVNRSIEEKNIKGYKWKIINGNKVDSFSTKDLDYNFKSFGVYKGFMIVNPDLSDCTDTAYINMEILPPINADFSYKYDTCIAGPIALTDLSKSGAGPILKWKWRFGRDSSIRQNLSYEYKTPGTKPVSLTVTDQNACTSMITKNILYQPVPSLVVVDPSVFTGCVPQTVKFNNLSFPIDSTYKIEWKFGEGGTSNKISPTHIYTKTGVFNVDLNITSPIGCTTSKSFSGYITILDKPDANFTYSPDVFTEVNRTGKFVSGSIGAQNLIWNFGGAGTDFQTEPTFTFPDTGLYKVVLLAIHENGCTDTATALIDVMPLVNLSLPTAFTPNNDGLNDSYKALVGNSGIANFELSIYNRWGENIFRTDRVEESWNGLYQNTGAQVPQGVYVYLVKYITSRGESKELRGSITLLR
jgi:gliding motility-associated-like protein